MSEVDQAWEAYVDAAKKRARLEHDMSATPEQKDEQQREADRRFAVFRDEFMRSAPEPKPASQAILSAVDRMSAVLRKAFKR